jgi:hypothetical protein
MSAMKGRGEVRCFVCWYAYSVPPGIEQKHRVIGIRIAFLSSIFSL